MENRRHGAVQLDSLAFRAVVDGETAEGECAKQDNDPVRLVKAPRVVENLTADVADQSDGFFYEVLHGNGVESELFA